MIELKGKRVIGRPSEPVYLNQVARAGKFEEGFDGMVGVMMGEGGW